MILLDGIDLDKIWKRNSMEKTSFLNYGQNLARLRFGSYEKIKIKKKNLLKKNANY